MSGNGPTLRAPILLDVAVATVTGASGLTAAVAGFALVGEGWALPAATILLAALLLAVCARTFYGVMSGRRGCWTDGKQMHVRSIHAFPFTATFPLESLGSVSSVLVNSGEGPSSRYVVLRFTFKESRMAEHVRAGTLEDEYFRACGNTLQVVVNNTEADAENFARAVGGILDDSDVRSPKDPPLPELRTI